MNDRSGESPIDPALDTKIKAAVHGAIKAKTDGYSRFFKGFLVGFGLLVTLLLGGGFMTNTNLIRVLHNFVFPVEPVIDELLGKDVAVSYSNSFWLGAQAEDDQARQIPFYADSAQDVKAFVDVIHTGSGALLEVSIKLSGAREPVWSGTGIRTASEPLSVSEAMRTQLEDDFEVRSDNIFQLVFEVGDDVDEDSMDRVFIRSLITVSGRESAAQ